MRRSIRSALLLGTLVLFENAALAGSLGVSPTLVRLGDANPTASLTLENRGSSATVVQLQMMSWTADETQDHYAPNEDLVATPPIVTLQPGRPQIVRIGINRAPDPQRELAYRLFIEEVPPPPKAGQPGLQVALRVGVPVFVEPLQPAQAALRWRATRGPDNAVTLHATNTGDAHLRLQKITLHATEPERLIGSRQAAAYLLPGQQRRWVMPAADALPTGGLRLSAESDGGVTDVSLDLAAD